MLDIPGFTGLMKIGSGSCSAVYSAVHLETGMQVAIKQILKNRISSDEELEYIRNEVNIHKELSHPNIVSWYGCMEDEEAIYLIMELAAGQTLLSMINMSGGLHAIAAQQQFVELMSAVRYLHEEKGVVHRDIKLDNLLYDHEGRVKLVDFGLGNRGSQCYRTQCGTYPYAAPEVFGDDNYTDAIDIWSCGIVLYAMITGRLPFESPNFADLIHKIRTEEPEYPLIIPDTAVDLIKRMLMKDPKERITLKEIATHPWVTESLNCNVFGFSYKNVDCSSVMHEVRCRMRQLGRNDMVNPDDESSDAMLFRIIKQDLLITKGYMQTVTPMNINWPRRFSGAAITVQPQKFDFDFLRKNRKMSDGEHAFKVKMGKSPLVVANKPRIVIPSPPPRKVYDDITRSIYLPAFTFA